MRVLVLYAHPVAESFGSALHQASVDALRRAGHEVDDCDLYAEGFDPVLSAEERRNYHDQDRCRAPVESYVERLLAAEGLVLVFPVWNYGVPAILKGYFDRVFLPGVAFTMADGKAWPSLHNIRRLAAVATYGGARWRAWLMGDLPRRLVKRPLRATIRPGARVTYLACYDMNRAEPAARAAFIDRVSRKMARF